MSEIYIKELELNQWQDHKKIRLKALQQCPGVYGASYDKTSQCGDVFWQEPLSSDDSVVFGLYDGDDIVGLAGVFTWKEDLSEKTAIFAMDFIDKKYRGQGLTKLIYESRIKWVRARSDKFDRMAIAHREGNEPSKRAMLSAGFQYTASEMIDWPDGQRDLEHKYQLQV